VRGETFVTRKITRGLANIAHGIQRCLFLGNLASLRDWGHAKDYVRMQWLMLQQDHAEDYVIATGRHIAVRDFVAMAAREAGMELVFSGTGADEIATVSAVDAGVAPGVRVGEVVVKVDSRYYRPTEVDSLLGDAAKARQQLGWAPEITVEDMCAEMVASDLEAAKCHALLMSHGHRVTLAKE
jgi:GDPmannose 4,6-dehydratase